MHKRFLTVAAIALFLLPTLAMAAHYSDFYVIPVAAKTPGVNGTNWMSDIAIQNFQTTPLSVELVFIESGDQTQDNIFPLGNTVTIPAGGSVLMTDVMKDFPGRTSVIGSILIGSTDGRAFAVTSRAYSMSPSGDTVGQTVVPVRDFLQNAEGTTNNTMATAYIPGLINNSRFRTNLGFVAGTISTGISVEYILKGADGAALGRREFFVGPGEFKHLQFSSTQIATTQFSIAGAEVRILSGSGAVIPYASVIDNVTADAVFVLGTFPPNTPLAKTSGTSAFREIFNRYTN